MNLTDIIGFENNPTLRVTYVVSLIDVLFFFLISLILRYVVNKKFLQNEQKKQSNINGLNKTMLIIVFAIVILINKKVYAVMAMTTYYFNIITITIYFIGIYIANFIIGLIINRKDINKTKFLEMFSETVIENIIFNTTLIVSMMTINNYMTINIIFAVIITSLYKIIKILLKEYNVTKKILIVVLYILILFFVGTSCRITENNYDGKGIFLKREVEEWKNGEYRIEDNISIEYDIDN